MRMHGLIRRDDSGVRSCKITVDVNRYYTSSGAGRLAWLDICITQERQGTEGLHACWSRCGTLVSPEQGETRSTNGPEDSTSISKHALIRLGTQQDQDAEALSQCVPAGSPEQQDKRAHAC